jgi:hypothetical protein
LIQGYALSIAQVKGLGMLRGRAKTQKRADPLRSARFLFAKGADINVWIRLGQLNEAFVRVTGLSCLAWYTGPRVQNGPFLFQVLSIAGIHILRASWTKGLYHHRWLLSKLCEEAEKSCILIPPHLFCSRVKAKNIGYKRLFIKSLYFPDT